MMSKELQNLDLINANLMTDVFKIIVKYPLEIIAKYRHLLPSGNRAFEKKVFFVTFIFSEFFSYLCFFSIYSILS